MWLRAEAQISVPSGQATKLVSRILENPVCSDMVSSLATTEPVRLQSTRPTGLAVRDSLRLEAGLCLYGHDLNEDINPIEASLAWTICERCGCALRCHRCASDAVWGLQLSDVVERVVSWATSPLPRR